MAAGGYYVKQDINNLIRNVVQYDQGKSIKTGLGKNSSLYGIQYC